MEDQKRKFLLSRILREQQLIKIEYDKFKLYFQGKNITLDRCTSYLHQISTIIQINNTLANNYYEYLQRPQMEAIFSRNTVIFADLLNNFKKRNNQLSFIDSHQDTKEIREICDVCHQKLQSNRILHIKNSLEDQSECRTQLIKKIIEQSEKQRISPLFTQDEDALFKKQLENVFKQKEMMLKININESSTFLATVESEITDFMISFRKEFADWQVNKQEVIHQNQNWGRIMKSYINKKLHNTFDNKMPKWIKKMHEVFLDNQPVKQKIYIMNKEIQATETFTEKELRLIGDVQELNHKIILQRQALKTAEKELEQEKILVKTLKFELDNVQKHFVNKLYDANKAEKLADRLREMAQLRSQNLLKNQRSPTKQSTYTQAKTEEIQTQNEDFKKKNRTRFSQMRHSLVKQNISTLIAEDQSTTINIQPIDQQSEYHPKFSKFRKSKQSIDILKESSTYITDVDKLRLKKKTYNRDKRSQVIGDQSKDQSNKLNSKYIKEERNKSKASENKKIKDNPNRYVKNGKNTEKQNTLAKQKSSLILQNQQQCIKDKNNESIQPNQQSLPTTDRKEENNIDLSSPNKKVENIIKNNIQKIRSFIDDLITLQKCEQQVSPIQKEQLTKLIHKFFENLAQKQLKSLGQLVRLPKINCSYKSSTNDHQANRSLIIKKKQKNTEMPKRKNKSLHQKPLHLPIISNSLHGQPFERHVDNDCCKLFIDDKIALKYEQSFLQPHMIKEALKPTPLQFQEIQNIYSTLEALKRINYPIYSQMCSFIRYPYTSIKNKYINIDIIKQFSFSAFCNFFFKIMWLHKQCTRHNTFCGHITGFINRLSTSLSDCRLQQKLLNSKQSPQERSIRNT